MFDLKSCGRNLCVAKKVHDELAVEVADADGLGHALANKFLHSRPGLLDASVTGDDILAVVSEARGVALRGVHVFERDREVDDKEVEVVDAPI